MDLLQEHASEAFFKKTIFVIFKNGFFTSNHYVPNYLVQNDIDLFQELVHLLMLLLVIDFILDFKYKRKLATKNELNHRKSWSFVKMLNNSNQFRLYHPEIYSIIRLLLLKSYKLTIAINKLFDKIFDFLFSDRLKLRKYRNRSDCWC